MSDASKRPGRRPHSESNPLNQGLKQYPDGSWGLDCIIHGRRRRGKVGKLSEARKYRDDLKSAERRGEVQLVEKKAARRTLGDWIDLYLSVNRGTTNTAFAEKWRASVGQLYPEQFTFEMLREWAHQRLTAGAEVASIQRSMDPLRATYAEALRSGEIVVAQNPFRYGYKGLSLPALNNKRTQYLPPEKLPDAREAFGSFWWPYAEFALLTLMRFANQRDLRWENIDWRARLATLERTKNGKKFHVRLSEVAVELLEGQKRSQEQLGLVTEWCFPNSHGGRLNAAHFRQRVWGPAFEKLGLKTMGAGGRNGMTWHDLSRHTGATYLAQDGESMYVLQGVMNHAELATTERYTVHSDDHSRRAMERLASLVRGVNSASIDSGSGVEKSSKDEISNGVTKRFSLN